MIERTKIRSHDGFTYSIGLGRVRIELLEDLFLLKGLRPVCVHTESLEEVRPSPDGSYSLQPNTTYVVFPEFVVEGEEEEPEEYRPGRPISTERMLQMNQAPFDYIRAHYAPLHPEIYVLKESFFDPALLKALNSENSEEVKGLIKQEADTGIFSLNFFTPDFCRILVEEIQNFEESGLPVSRPNSMNNYGLILHDVGFTPFLDQLVVEFFAPLCRLLFPDEPLAQEIDSHHSFIVQYKMTEDLDLGFHYDDSETTLNVCLGKEFSGGDLYFKGILGRKETHEEDFLLSHVAGRAVIHRGKHRHGATRITGGERYNLIVWGRNHLYRQARREGAHYHPHAHSPHHCDQCEGEVKKE